MAEEATTLKTTFEEAERLREGLEGGIAPQSVQLILTAALLQYEKSLEIAVQIPLFSHNEELEDVSSEDLKFVMRDFLLSLNAKTYSDQVLLDRLLYSPTRLSTCGWRSTGNDFTSTTTS